MIDRYALRYFLAVVDNGNFSRAAAQVNVAQPTLSVGIAKLEKKLGVRLFHRTSKRVHLTPEGTRFLNHARTIENEFNAAESAVRAEGSAEQLRVGLLNSIATDYIAGAIKRAGKPMGQVEFVEGSERQLANHLARGRVDIALTLVGRGGDRFLEETLYEEGYALALASDHPLAKEDMIPAEALGNEIMMVRRHCEALSETSRHFTERGVRPFFAFRSTDDDKILKMVACGLGITVMPQGHEAAGVVRPKMLGFDIRRKIGVAFGHHKEALAQTSHPVIDAFRAGASSVLVDLAIKP
tara:strand:+ start:1477 stop:2367 length:891 start_codon:yes stop_codon:yes gene_type:complete